MLDRLGEPVVLVEALRVGEPLGHTSWSEAVPGEEFGLWDGDEAEELLGLLAALPAGERMRCFIPRYGLRLHTAGGDARDIAFCFRCHTALVLGPGGAREWPAFDGESAPARELLCRFRAAGAQATGPRTV
ncbi:MULTISPECIES: hypothetical protein [Streptomyces]|uniref:hypothetical protein n=1 Tax=Streptomyces TaxID=1883 RepID=UPI001114A0ED|nr:hypothetical protein [Streptomyces pini]